jgi:hypothetical protein
MPANEPELINRIAILANQYSVEGLAEMLGLDTDFVNYVLEGYGLTRQQGARLQRAYSTLETEADDGLQDIDFDEVNMYASNLENALYFVNEGDLVGDEFQNVFRQVVADGRIDIEKDLAFDTYGMFANLGFNHKYKVFNWLAEGNDPAEMFEAYLTDMREKGTIWFEKGNPLFDESYWWAWFRETFYA